MSPSGESARHHVSSRPSRLLLGLLSTFGCGRDVDALVGDLTEERRGGRSVTWLFWQVLVGVGSTFAFSVRTHPWVILRALVVAGVALKLTYQSIYTVLIMSEAGPYDYAFLPPWAFEVFRWPPLAFSVLTFGGWRPMTSLSGFRGIPSEVYFFAAWPPVAFAIFAVAGLTVGRLHRSQRAAALISCTSVLGGWTALTFIHRLSHPPPLYDGDITSLVFIAAQSLLSDRAVELAGFLTGGLWMSATLPTFRNARSETNPPT